MHKRTGITVMIVLLVVAFCLIIAITQCVGIDSDDDGYPDDVDDFPNDPTLHSKCSIVSSSGVPLQPGEIYHPSGCPCFNISCDCKCLEIDWHIQDATTQGYHLAKKEKQQVKMFINIYTQRITISYDSYEFAQPPFDGSYKIKTQHKDDWGKWEIYFENSLQNPPVNIDYSIYKMI